MPSPIKEVHTEHFDLYWTKGRTMTWLHLDNVKTENVACDLLSVNAQDPVKALSLPFKFPPTAEEFARFGSALQKLVTKTLVIRIKDGDEEEVVTIPASLPLPKK